ncbi:stage II sporulation protein E [Mobilisporobacter senegalensis]|uniref:Stage II sporulation protein E n=1 Tax=Mobilisporobacter senegalensis TaxID=1329262 RepID=A0A3N1XHU2_9FIRM|nr:stage II sporulation protein E [Mobilisporobacter senegalensis]ROR25668.1 stage II sporulation protein E [Mobilisporobacter senegalensis]
MKGMNKRAIFINLIAAILARAVFLNINPVAIGYFGAVYLNKSGRFILCIATLIGMTTVMPIVDVVKYSIIMLTIMVVISLIEKKEKKLPVPVMGGIAGIITSTITLTKGFMTIDFNYYVTLAILEGILVFALVGIFHKGVNYIMYSKKGQTIGNEEMISVGIISAMIVYALPGITWYGVSVVQTGAFFAILLLGYKYGAGAGAIAGTGCGMVIGLQRNMLEISMSTNNDLLSIIGMLCMLGILVGMFRGTGRLGTGLMYGATGILLTYIAEGNLLISNVGAISSSVIIFILFPGSVINRVNNSEIVLGEEIFAKQNLQHIGKDKLRDFSDSFKKLSSTFRSIADTKMALSRRDINQIFDDLSDKLCKNCENCEVCWKNEFYDTYKSAFLMLNSAEHNGAVLERDIPESFSKRCIFLKDFIYETNKGLELAKVNLNWQNRMAESREAIAGQLLEVSNIINDFSRDLYGTVEVKDSKETLITKTLLLNHIDVKKIAILEKRNKKQEIYITATTKRGRCITTREAANIISEVFGKKMRPADGTKNIISRDTDTFVFVEETTFKTLTGMAKATKENEKISGDNYSFIHLGNGEMIMTLSDGMGTGAMACAESESVIELLEQFMEAGFREESAIKLINSILVLKSEKQSFSTIDMSIINLFTGICQFIKIGASTTFIKREHWVESISSTSLPVGVFNQVDFDGITKKLYDGDFIIMVTDGVLDCIIDQDKEKFMEDVIMNITSQNPQEIANIILDKAIEQNNYTAVDDMTVIVAGIWKK